jgi:hypothetical protein
MTMVGVTACDCDNDNEIKSIDQVLYGCLLLTNPTDKEIKLDDIQVSVDGIEDFLQIKGLLINEKMYCSSSDVHKLSDLCNKDVMQPHEEVYVRLSLLFKEGGFKKNLIVTDAGVFPFRFRLIMQGNGMRKVESIYWKAISVDLSSIK